MKPKPERSEGETVAIKLLAKSLGVSEEDAALLVESQRQVFAEDAKLAGAEMAFDEAKSGTKH